MYEYLVLSAGGVKAISYMGSFKALERLKIAPKIKGIIGCSAGSLLALLFVIGYKPEEMLEIITNINLGNYTDDGLESLIKNLGSDNGIKLMNLIYAVCKQKYDLKEITFAQLYESFPIELVMVGSNITESKSIYFSYKTTPNVLVLDALRISISVPFKFTPIRYDNKICVDGAVYDPYPIEYFSDQNTLGFVLNKLEDLEPIDNLLQYTLAILISIEHKELKRSFQKHKSNTVQIICNDNPINFSMDKERKKELYDLGYNTTINFLANKYYNKKLIKFVFNKIKKSMSSD